MACCRRGGWLARMAGVTAILYIVAWSALGPLLDPHKSYGPVFPGVRRPAGGAARPAAHRLELDETTRAGFYFYADRVFPRIREPDDTGGRPGRPPPDGNSVIVVRKKSAALGEALVHATLLWENKLGNPARRAALSVAHGWDESAGSLLALPNSLFLISTPCRRMRLLALRRCRSPRNGRWLVL
jgi:hypothetical protein